MELADAEKEFWLRIYIWAKAEWEKEINESFPHLRLFKTGHAWDIYQFMQKLSKEEQLALAAGRLKQGYRDAASAWGDKLSAMEESLCRKFDAFSHIKGQFRLFEQLRGDGKTTEANIVFEVVCAEAARILFDTDSSNAEFLLAQLDAFFGSIPSSFEEQVEARKQAGEKLRFAAKKKLQKTITRMFKESFAGGFVDFRIDDFKDNPWTSFDIKCSGWILTTQFTFGRQQSFVSHRHSIQSETRIRHPQNPSITGPAMTLCSGTAWPCAWSWDYLMNEDVELACNETLRYCRYFYEAAPRLLKGLEFQNIAAELNSAFP